MSTAVNNAFFESVPDKDYCDLFTRNHPNAKKVMSMLNYSKKDLAIATGFSANSIRLDERIQSQIEERLREWAVTINLVASYFKNIDRTMLWFQTPNPLLGNISPADMIKMGRSKKLLQFIQTALEENKKSIPSS